MKINNVDTINITSLGALLSTTTYPTGTVYTVTIDTPNSIPNKCAIANATGTIASGDITNIAINCRAFKYIFPTTNTYNGNLGGVSGADSICNSDAARPDTTSTYKALMGQIGSIRRACREVAPPAFCAGDSANRIDWVLYPNTEYRRTNGSTIIAVSNADRVFTFPLTNSISSIVGNYWCGLGAGSAWTIVAISSICGLWSMLSS